MTAQPSPDPLSPALREEIEREMRAFFAAEYQTAKTFTAAAERIARAAVREERERTLRTLASATRKVLSPELVALLEAELRRGLARQIADECGNWTPLKAIEAAQPGSDALPERNK